MNNWVLNSEASKPVKYVVVDVKTNENAEVMASWVGEKWEVVRHDGNSPKICACIDDASVLKWRYANLKEK